MTAADGGVDEQRNGCDRRRALDRRERAEGLELMPEASRVSECALAESITAQMPDIGQLTKHWGYLQRLSEAGALNAVEVLGLLLHCGGSGHRAVNLAAHGRAARPHLNAVVRGGHVPVSSFARAGAAQRLVHPSGTRRGSPDGNPPQARGGRPARQPCRQLHGAESAQCPDARSDGHALEPPTVLAAAAERRDPIAGEGRRPDRPVQRRDQVGSLPAAGRSARTLVPCWSFDNQITAGAIVAASMLMSRALAPMEMTIGAWRQCVAARSAYVRLNTLLEQSPSSPRRLSLPAPRGVLRVQDVVAWLDGTPAPTLRCVTFTLAPGDVLAVIGSSGSGKSTLARLIVGAAPPYAGKVRLDNADINMSNKEELGPHLDYLSQDVELFEGTVAQNIARFGELKSAKIVDAAQCAGVHDIDPGLAPEL
jgi:ABC transporter